MAFHVSASGAGADEIIYLEDDTEGIKAQIFAFGALLNAFSISVNGTEKNVIFGFKNSADAGENITPLFQSAKLSPFVCRMKEGQYTFANEKYKIEKYYSAREAIHGLIYDAVFTVKKIGTTAGSAFVTLTYDYNKSDAGYPFFYRADITYQLRRSGSLTITTKIKNLSAESIPVSDGWHPYFCFGNKVDELHFFMDANQMAEFDSKLLPTGNVLPYHQFQQLQPIGDADLDNCFVLNENTTQPACALRDPQSGVQLNIFVQKNYPFLQVFIPKTRDCIALENLSALPDSFNNAIGLTILEPAQSEEFITSYRLRSIH